ncbi:sigma-70 family RNA polymerase sigma factor [Salinarimonas chemoclinalis]|uniref:sigma-70 family RNA polymerase sigma factor n=1 Tax=Salinarimonas chemoclinalis TaxID=3241599 RepID=UPI0035565E79
MGDAAEITAHVRSLRRYALQLTRSRDAADDLVQECLARALANASTLKPGLPVRPWLFRILHNLHVSEQRKLRLRRATLLDPAEERVPASQDERLELRAVLDAVARLPDDQRSVLHLVAVEGMSYQEASRILEIPIGTLMSRLARGRETLRRSLQQPRAARLQVVGGCDAR